MGKKEIYIRASVTAEAAIVVPVMAFCIIAFIWVLFYLHNSVKADADLDMNSFIMEREAAENHYKTDHEILNMTDKLDGYYGAEIRNAIVQLNGRHITGQISIRQCIPLEGLFSVLLSGVSEIEKSRDMVISDRSEILRIIKAASELVGNLVDIYKNSGDKE